jgi:twitching motility protein PilI
MAADEADFAAVTGSAAVDAGMLLAAEIQGEAARARRFGFRLGGFGFLVPLGVTSEVLQQARLYALPWQVPCMRGLVNVRGNVVPVFDLTPLFGDGAASETPYTLIIDGGYRAVGLMTATLPTTLQCEADEEGLETGIPPVLAPYVRGSATANRQRWFEFDHLTCLQALATSKVPTN